MAGCLASAPPAAVRHTLYAGWREVYGCWYPPSPPGRYCLPATVTHGYPPPQAAGCMADPLPAPAPWQDAAWSSFLAHHGPVCVVILVLCSLMIWFILRPRGDAG